MPFASIFQGDDFFIKILQFFENDAFFTGDVLIDDLFMIRWMLDVNKIPILIVNDPQKIIRRKGIEFWHSICDRIVKMSHEER